MSDTTAVEDFKRIVDALALPVAVADATGAIAFANQAFLALTSKASLGTAFAAAERKRLMQTLARVAEGKAAATVVDAPLEDGRWFQVALQPLMGAGNRPSGVIAILTDIGAERDIEGELNLAAARLLALAEATPAAVMIENAKGEIELANEAFCRLLELESAPQSLPGLAVADVVARSAHAKKIQRQPILVDDSAVGAVWTAAEHAVERGASVKAATEVGLIEKIAMELSVALEGISAVSIRAQQMDIDPALVESVQRIRRSTETAMAAIGDLVDFSKMSGGVVLHKTQFALRESLASLATRLMPDAEEHQCRVRIKIEQDVADSLEGDVERLDLVLKNLLESAFVLEPGSEVSLQIVPEYVTESGIQLSFSVTAESKSPPKGSPESGMGVAVAKFMVAAMGGKIAISSRPGEAMYTFTLEFPVRPAPPKPERATYLSLVGLPVLVVSGDSDQRLALTNLLRGWRMVPLEADNAPMAMALLERMAQEGTPIPLVILSNELPMQDGFLLAFRIKNHRRFRSTLVMMLATHGKPGDAIACRENGISAYMRYPVNDRQLNEAIVAVTGASVNVDETPTLVTRHSLREQRKGATVLLVDAQRDAQIIAAHLLGKNDCNLVLAQDLNEALAALDQDVYDMVLVDTSLAGLSGEDAARALRARITRDPDKVRLVATTTEHSPEFHAAKTAIGFNATLAKPFRREGLAALLTELGLAPAAA